MNQSVIAMELMPLLNISIIFVAILIFMILFIYIFYLKKNYRKMQVQDKRKARFREELLLVQLEIQEQAIKNVSHEFHDMIGQEMSLIKLNLNTIDASNRADVENKITVSKDLLSKTITELRNLTKTMDIESIIGKGLYKAIGAEMERIQQSTGIRPHLFVKDEPPKLDPRKELILFRIIQELLQNIVSHASTKNIYFATDVNHKNFMLSISDDGREPEPGITNEFKITSMNIQGRARLIDADLYFETIKEKGTVVSIRLPLEN